MSQIKTIKTLLGCVVLLLLNKVYSQAPDFIEGYNLGGTNADYGVKSIWSYDSTIVQCGRTYSDNIDLTNNYGNSDFWISEMDTSGNILKSKNFGGSNYDDCNDVIQLVDSGYLLVGTTQSNDFDVSFLHGVSDFWVVRIDKNFNLIWEKTYGGTNQDEAKSVFKSSDGNWVISGFTISQDGDVSSNNGSADFWVIKIDINGDIIWGKNFGGSDLDVCYQGSETFDGLLVFGGKTYSDNGDVIDFKGGSDYWLITCDANGILLSSNCYGSSNFEICYSMFQINKNLYLAGRIQGSGGDITEYNGGIYDIWILCLDSTKNIIWEKNFGGSGNDEPFNIKGFSNNECIISGATTSNDGDITETYSDGITYDYWVFTIDSNGTLIWQISLGGTAYDEAHSSLLSLNKTYYISGWSNSIDGLITDNIGYVDSWTAKLRFCNNIYYADLDSDGYGDIYSDTLSCELPLGYVIDSTDCNDLNFNVHPDLIDFCNAVDDNCNGLTDEDATFTTYFEDEDGDTFGDILHDSTTCYELIGYVLSNTDCNDANNEIFPGAPEICNSIDDDCDGVIDDNVTFIQSYFDADNDNFGNPDIDSIGCEIPSGYVLDSSDCDDTNPDIFPGAIEILNGLDDDCDQVTDEGLSIESLEYGFNIYPNPTQDFIYISNTLGLESSYSISTIQGGVLLNETQFGSTLIIDVQNYASGMYLLIIQTEFGAITQTFIKE